MSDLRTAAQQALEALEMSRRFVYADNRPQCDDAIDALRAALVQQAEPVQEPDLSRCPQCNGPADNGHDRSIPPNPYLCTKCMAEPPQRKPLAKEQILYIYNQLPNWGMDMDSLPQGLEKFARAIERAHGIKERV